MNKFVKSVSTVALVTLCSTVLSTVTNAEEKSYQSNGLIEFTPNDAPTPPVDPNKPDPGKPVKPIDPTNPEGPNPGTAGPLSIDYASSLDFGKNKITNKDEVYFANAQGFSEGEIAGQFRGNYVQVSDNRGNFAGWTLSVKQAGQFASEDAKKAKSLTGAQISLTGATAESNSIETERAVANDVTLVADGAAAIVMSAKDGVGAGTWTNHFGDAEEMTIEGAKIQKNKAVTLSIPGATPKEAVKYKTKLIWTLSEVPGS